MDANHSQFGFGQKWKWFCFSSLLLLLLLYLGGIAFRSPKEPEFAGKSLSDWLAELDTGRMEIIDFRAVLDPQAAEAIRQIGQPAVPFLIEFVKSGYSAISTYYALDSLPVKLPLRVVEQRLDHRMSLARQAVLGFRVLGTNSAEAVPDLASLLAAKNEQSALQVWEALSATGPASLNVISNGLRSSSYFDPGHAAIAAGFLGRDAEPLAPLLVSMLNDPKHDRVRPFVLRALGRIGEPRDTVLPVLQQALADTNNTIVGNAAIGLMLLGDAGRVALPQIQQCWVGENEKANLFSLLAYIVLSTNDSQIVQEIDQTRSKLGVKETWEAALASASHTPTEVLAQVRTGWTNASPSDRRDLFEMLRAILPIEENK
ncbi:MAG: HEAT repeat domain-containing protein [Verrucomicrobiae bacterium]|nr:HEAT repeat domain-containing protein [Verrucomicrobiae bacterium]